MKKGVSLILAILLACSFVSVFASDVVLTPGSPDVGGGYIDRGAYIGFKNVDLTGIQSVTATATASLTAFSNGVTLGIVTDDPKTGEVLGYLVFNESGSSVTVSAPIKAVSGKHDVYFVSTYDSSSTVNMTLERLTLSSSPYADNRKAVQIPDSAIVDNFHDTWTATDDMGRAVADYEEAGAVKEGTRDVGIFYWDWHYTTAQPGRAQVIPEIVAAHPEAKDNYSDPAWDLSGTYYWAEPLLGFYTMQDYFVLRRHAQMLADAGVDAIFFDYSNGGKDMVQPLNLVAKAFRDAKAAGVDIPRLSLMGTLGGDEKDSYTGLAAIYFNCFVANDYSDIWYYWEGKPCVYGGFELAKVMRSVDSENTYEVNIAKEMDNFFTVRGTNGQRNNPDPDDFSWKWIENFPQTIRYNKSTDRPEFICVAVALNQSTVFGPGVTGVFSDPYNMGRGYSEVFGEDYSLKGKRMGYYFRDQSALALSVDPKFVMIDGWNEFTAIRNISYGGFPNAFVDLYDDENSRDFEPVKGDLKDDYYNLMTDFIRKYKGVRKAPVATGAKTIDINGDAAQWETVGPQFINDDQSYERSTDGLRKANTKDEYWHYETKIYNAIEGAKVSFDPEKLYFMAETKEAIREGTPGWMHLYINADRNRATGWEGYDFAINVPSAGAISAYNGGWQTIGTAEYTVKGNALQLAVSRALLNETDTVDLEFKWTDGVTTEGDLLSFYTEGSVAPMGRFNYLYTEIEQQALSFADHESLKKSQTSVMKAGSNKMVAAGGKRTLYEADTRVTAFTENGTLYVPEDAFNEIMGYGHNKTEYNPDYNYFFTYHYEMGPTESRALQKVSEYNWTYSVLDSCEVHVDGELRYLSAPVTYRNGVFYVPLSLIAECYGWNVSDLGGGIYTVTRDEADASALSAAIGLLN